MIFTDRTIIVKKGTSSIDDTIVLYRGDKEVEIRFTLNESSPFRFGSGASPNIIEKTEAAYGQLVIKTPNDLPSIFSEIMPTNKGKIIFTITAEMIDEITEVGNYTFQIRLFDENRESRATLPEVENGIEIREPIATEDVSTTNEVGVATVGYALTTAATPEDTFDSQGNYNKTTWAAGDRITAAKLNKIEAGIDGVNKKVASGGTGSNNASDISIADTGNYFTSTNVEGALQEASSQIKDIANNNGITEEQISNIIQEMINNGKINIQSSTIHHPLKGLKWGVIGDSITDDEHLPVNQHYDQVISDITGINNINYGILATTVSIRDGRTDSMLERVNILQTDLDIITVLGGTNDFGLGIPLGEMGSTDTKTFYGAYDAMALALIKKYPNKPIGFITPLARGYNNNLKNYRNAIKEIGEKYCIPVLDLYAESGLCCDINEINTSYFLLGGDKLHPNAEGHKIIARPILKFLNELCADKIYTSTTTGGGTGGGTGGETGGETGGGTGGGTGGETGGEYIMATADNFTNVLGANNTISIDENNKLTITNGSPCFNGNYNVYTIDCRELVFTIPSDFAPDYLPIVLYESNEGNYYSIGYNMPYGLKWNVSSKSYIPGGTSPLFNSQSKKSLDASKGDTVRLVKTSNGIEGYVNDILKLSLNNNSSMNDINSNSKFSDSITSVTTTFGFGLLPSSTLSNIKYKI